MGDGLFSPMHLLIVLIVVILLFGAKKLPELGKGLGTGIREFKKGLDELHTDDETPAAAPKVTGGTTVTIEAAPTPANTEHTSAPTE